MTQRLRIAGTRAIESQTKLRRIAEQIDRGLDEATPPNGVVAAFLSEEDSMVTSVAEVIERSRIASTPPPVSSPAPVVGRVSTKLMHAKRPSSNAEGSNPARNGSGSYSIITSKK